MRTRNLMSQAKPGNSERSAGPPKSTQRIWDQGETEWSFSRAGNAIALALILLGRTENVSHSSIAGEIKL